MDEKDKQIERLFDDYASSLEPNAQLANKAKQKLKARRKAKRPIFWVGFASACAAAVAIAVFSVLSFSGNDGLSGGGSDNSAGTSTAQPAPSAQSYSISEVRAVSVDVDFAKDYINTTELVGAEVFSQAYYACYIKETNEFVYLKAVLGVSYNGGNLQMSVVAENADYAGKELSVEYTDVVNKKGYAYTVERIRGEYVTKAYCKAADYNYYVTAMGNAYGAQDIAAMLIGTN